jgi:predicted nucleotidyltransferase
MNVVERTLHDIAEHLGTRNQHWALVGGFAVSVRAEPRFTADVDVAVAVADDLDAERLVRDLMSVGYRVVASIEQDQAARLATVRLASPAHEDVVVDLLFASSGIEPEIVAAAEHLEILPGLTIPIAQTGHLIAVKLLARDDRTRPQDLADLRALLAVATAADLDTVRAAIRLISGRGYDRGRDLEAALATVLASARRADSE